MRKLKILMFMTLDGAAELPDYANAPNPNDPGEGPTMWTSRMDSIDTLLLGRKSYELWADFWPRQKDEPSAGKFMKEFSRFADRAEKVVVSKSLRSADWPTSRILSGDLSEEVTRLKSLPGKDIALGGGPRLAQSVLERDLADDLVITLFPTLVGRGKPFFHVAWNPDHPAEVVPVGAPGRHDFKLIDARPDQEGTVLLHYARPSP
jgi:dihydrofolate reductase